LNAAHTRCTCNMRAMYDASDTQCVLGSHLINGEIHRGAPDLEAVEPASVVPVWGAMVGYRSLGLGRRPARTDRPHR
jgi:hypothetical protein